MVITAIHDGLFEPNSAMNISLLVQGAPYSTDACVQALNFAQATVRKSHQIQTVFFYKDAVAIANESFQIPKDELNIQQEWINFATAANVQLNICVGASHRRGIATSSTGEIAPTAFNVIGLGVFIEHVRSSDRIVVFL